MADFPTPVIRLLDGTKQGTSLLCTLAANACGVALHHSLQVQSAGTVCLCLWFYDWQLFVIGKAVYSSVFRMASPSKIIRGNKYEILRARAEDRCR